MKMLSLTKDWNKISLKSMERKLSDPQLYPEVLLVCKLGLSPWRDFPSHLPKPWAWSWHLQLLSVLTGGKWGESSGHPCVSLNWMFYHNLICRLLSATGRNCYYHHPCFISREKEPYSNFINIFIALCINEEERVSLRTNLCPLNCK